MCVEAFGLVGSVLLIGEVDGFCVAEHQGILDGIGIVGMFFVLMTLHRLLAQIGEDGTDGVNDSLFGGRCELPALVVPFFRLTGVRFAIDHLYQAQLLQIVFQLTEQREPSELARRWPSRDGRRRSQLPEARVLALSGQRRYHLFRYRKGRDFNGLHLVV